MHPEVGQEAATIPETRIRPPPARTRRTVGALVIRNTASIPKTAAASALCPDGNDEPEAWKSQIGGSTSSCVNPAHTFRLTEPVREASISQSTHPSAIVSSPPSFLRGLGSPLPTRRAVRLEGPRLLTIARPR